MKKFTQIITRRIARSSPDYDNSPPYESNCFHQLTSTRLVKGDSFKRSTPRSGNSRFVADDAHFQEACWTCKGIDFPKVLSWQPGDRRPWVPLAHTLEPEFPNCPYCNFFHALIGDEVIADESGKFMPYLRIRQAFERLGVKEKHELGGAVLFEVMTKNKSLPEGYLVKLADDEYDIDNYESCPRRPEIRGRTVSPLVDLSLPKTWVDFCKDNHSGCDCVRNEPLVEGMRLIDCSTKLIVSASELDTESIEYVTLSSCVSSGGRGLLKEKSLENDVPKLIDDAMELTISLGFRYLWADTYCFPSIDPKNDAERRKQIGLVGEIFAQSALTVVIAADIGLRDGIPGVSVSREPQLSLQMENSIFTTTLLRPDLEVSGYKWASHGWNFQETVLSRRRLVFTPSQIYFQCRTLHCHESLSLPLQFAPGLNLGRIFPEGGAGTVPEHFSQQMRAYVTKEFEHPSDRLDAFQGIIHHFSNIPRAIDCFVALPLFHADEFAQEDTVVSRTSRLAVALGWTPERERTAISQPYTDPLMLSHEDSFPSWTWLSWRLRAGHGHSAQHLHFHFFEEFKPHPLDGVTAPPKMNISVGFENDEVLAWETEAEAINSQINRVKFLRLSAYCFDIRLRKDGDTLIILGLSMSIQAKDAIKGWLRASISPPASPDTSSASESGSLPNGEYKLTGVVLSGRGWREPGPKAATILICGPKSWGSNEGKLIRLGALSLTFGGFTPIDDHTAVMEAVDLNSIGGKGDIELQHRDLDLY